MIRVIKRYAGGSRKLYDTEESRYVSLEEISAWIGAGQEIQVLDSGTGEDVTAQILAQTLFEDHKRGQSILPTRFLHDMIRKGHDTLNERLEAVKAGMDRLMDASLDKVAFSGPLQEDMDLLKARLAELEASLADLEQHRKAAAVGGSSSKQGKRRSVRR
jgi:polyhydroxyalkanoate synthesis repressor PhaR